MTFQEDEAPLAQYLTFRLADETYAIDVTHAREVVEYSQTTSVPNAPQWVRGIINLRGSIVPVLDVKQKFGMPPTQCSADTRIIIVELGSIEDRMLLGILADGVRNVVEASAEQVEPPPAFGGTISSNYVRGIGRVDGEYFVILDIARVFSGNELSVAANVVSEKQ